MKRWKIILPSLLATTSLPLVSLVSCGNPEDKPEFKQDGIGEIVDSKTAIISIDWTTADKSMKFTKLSFSCNGGTIQATEIRCFNPSARPCRFEIKFNNDLTKNIADGIFNFHYKGEKDIIGKKTSIEGIQIANDYIDSESFYSINENGQFLVYDRSTLETDNPDTDIKATNKTTSEEISFVRKDFNEPLKIGTKMKTIGERFLKSCESFNQNLTLPNGLETIGKWFFCDCHSFNQTLILPNSLTNVYYGFCYNCKNLITGINIQDLDPSIFEKPENNDWTLTTNDKNAPMFTTGVLITGTNAKGFVSKFGRRGATPYRQLRSE